MNSDDLLESYGLKYEDLNTVERETFSKMANDLQENALSIDRIKDYVREMKRQVETELTQPNLDTNQDLLLKARLRNYMLFEVFLDTPDRIKKQLERSLANIAKVT